MCKVQVVPVTQRRSSSSSSCYQIVVRETENRQLLDFLFHTAESAPAGIAVLVPARQGRNGTESGRKVKSQGVSVENATSGENNGDRSVWLRTGRVSAKSPTSRKEREKWHPAEGSETELISPSDGVTPQSMETHTSPMPTSGPRRLTSGLPIIRAIAEYLSEFGIPTTSPWDGFVFPTRERTSRTIRAEQRNAHHLTRAIFDRGGALISVEVRLSEARGH